MKSNNQPKSKMPWYRRKWVWAIAAVWLLLTAIAATGSSNTPNQNTDKKQAQNAPQFADFIRRPMTDVASEFSQTYNATQSTQIKANKNGYKLFFEDGGRLSDAAKINTDKVTTASIELPEMGKCEKGQVFNKSDDAMNLVGLKDTIKGNKHDGMGGVQQGYGAYRNFKGDKTLELALLCDYDGDNYNLQVRVLPEYR